MFSWRNKKKYIPDTPCYLELLKQAKYANGMRSACWCFQSESLLSIYPQTIITEGISKQQILKTRQITSLQFMYVSNKIMQTM